MQPLGVLGNLASMPAALVTASLRLRNRAVFVVLLPLGLALVSRCHTEAGHHAAPVSAVAASDQANQAETAAHADHVPHEDRHCDESGTVLADQRTDSLSASVLLGLGVFAFVGLPVLPPHPMPDPSRPDGIASFPF